MADLWFRKLDNFNEADDADREFWSRMSPEERVAVVEDLRRTWLKMKGLPDEGVQRVIRVIELQKPSQS